MQVAHESEGPDGVVHARPGLPQATIWSSNSLLECCKGGYSVTVTYWAIGVGNNNGCVGRVVRSRVRWRR
jgi:hypothetical protein